MDIRSSKGVQITKPSIKLTGYSLTPQGRCSDSYWSFGPVMNDLLLDQTIFQQTELLDFVLIKNWGKNRGIFVYFTFAQFLFFALKILTKTYNQRLSPFVSLTFHSALRKLNTEPPIGASHQVLVIWLSSYREENIQKSTNQKQEWTVVAMFINGSELNEQSLQMTFQ